MKNPFNRVPRIIHIRRILRGNWTTLKVKDYSGQKPTTNEN